MYQPQSFNNQNNLRQSQRYPSALPIKMTIGTQVSMQGQLRDLSSKSAFVVIKNSFYLQPNDELDFVIGQAPDNADGLVKGKARISRISGGEGFAIYFTEMDDASAKQLKSLVE